MPRISILLTALLLAWPAAAQTPPQPYRPAPIPQGAPSAPPVASPAAPAAPAAGQPAIAFIDKARQLWRENRLLQAMDELDAATVSIARQLGQAYAPSLPPAPQGWSVAPADPQRLAALGSGVATVREYRPAGAPAAQPGAQGAGPAQMVARIVIDRGAIEAMQPLFAPQLPQGVAPTVRKTRINDQDAVVAYDPQRKAGEVSMLVGNRLLLQVEGLDVANAEPMLAVMRQWNTAELRRVAGL
jgi:hypothetical protein